MVALFFEDPEHPFRRVMSFSARRDDTRMDTLLTLIESKRLRSKVNHNRSLCRTHATRQKQEAEQQNNFHARPPKKKVVKECFLGGTNLPHYKHISQDCQGFPPRNARKTKGGGIDKNIYKPYKSI